MKIQNNSSHSSPCNSDFPHQYRVLCAAILTLLYPAYSSANPNKAQIVSGQVSIDQSISGVTTIKNSPNAIINWQDFNIAKNEITQFIQQNGQSAVLNRIVGGNPSEILGSLFSNGKVFLINPNGIVFGAGSQVDTQGLVASSLNLSNSDFQNGNFHFIAGSKAGEISNEGIIHAGKDGNIVLIAPNIENNGIIKSDGGKIVLAAGQELILTSMDDPDIRFQVQAPQNQVLNVGQLLTEGGSINVFAGSIKHSGDISADSVEIDKQGNIRLVATGDVTLEKDSQTTANNEKGVAGKIEVTGEKVAVLDNSKLSATGEKGGGDILIGGDYQGKNAAVQNAKTTTIAEKVEIQADAKTDGKGGKVIAWSDNETKVAAKISAKGGAKSGDGGFVETSAHILDVNGIRVDASSPKGKSGEWLLDPYDVTIDSSTSGGGVLDGSNSFTSSGSSSSISAQTIATALENNSVTISTGGIAADGFGNGDINVNSSITKAGTSNTTLTLNAHNDIIFDNASFNSSLGRLNISFDAGGIVKTCDGDCYNQVSISTNGGDLTIKSADVTLQNASITGGSGNLILQPSVTSGTIGLAGGTGSFNLSTTELGYFSGFSNITIGDIEGTGKIDVGTVDWTVPSTANLTLQNSTNSGDGITLHQSLGNGTNVALKTSKLELKNQWTGDGNTNYTFNNSSNLVSTLAGGGSDGDEIGSLDFVNSGTLTIGTVGTTSGITTTGTISVATNGGDLIINDSIHTDDATSYTYDNSNPDNPIMSAAIKLNADKLATTDTTNNIKIGFTTANSLARPTITMGSDGTGLLLTGSVNGSADFLNLNVVSAGNFRYHSDESILNFTTPVTSGIYAIYREQPTISVTANTINKTYDGSVAYNGNSGVTIATLVNGDTLTGFGYNYGYSNFDALLNGIDVGTYTVTPSASTTDLIALGYETPTFHTGTLTINPVQIYVEPTPTPTFGVKADDKTRVYGDVNPVFTYSIISGNLVGNDTAESIGLTMTTPATITSPVGNYSIIPSITSSNYIFTGNNGTLSITPASLSIANLSVNNKVYDTTTMATLSGGTLTGILNSDDVTLSSGLSGTFADKNVGTAKVVTISNYALTGTQSLNYTLVAPANLSANITPAALTIANLSALDKTYDATPTATLNGGTLSGVFANDEVALSSTLTGQFDNKNVGTNKTVSVSPTSLAGQDATNYTVATPANLSATITPAVLTITNLSALDKTYDATPTATLNGGTLSGVFANDVVALSSTLTGQFDNKNVGTNKTVNVSPTSLAGQDATNYTVATPANLSATITPAALTITNLSALDKTYDATPTATLNGGTLSGVFANDVVALSSTLTGQFDNKNVGTNKAVSVSPSTLTGSDAANYTVNVTANLSANITPALLAITATGDNKKYDGSTIATVNLADNRIDSDVFSVSYSSAEFSDPNVGIKKPITISGLNIIGTDAGNYTFNSSVITNADINRISKIEWIGKTDNTWATPTNWNQGVVPDETQDVIISNTGNVIDISGNQIINSLFSLNSLHLANSSSMTINNPFTLQNGTTLSGNGGFKTSKFTNEGIISPGNSPGAISIDGNFVQNSTGLLDIQIAGDIEGLYDQLDVSGAVQLGGTIKLSLIDGYVLKNSSNTFNFIKTNSTISGSFDQIDTSASPSLNNRFNFVNGKLEVSTQPPDTPLMTMIKQLLPDSPPEKIQKIEEGIFAGDNAVLNLLPLAAGGDSSLFKSKNQGSVDITIAADVAATKTSKSLGLCK